MAKKVHQFRFYKDNANDLRNEPNQTNYTNVGGIDAFITGALFDGSKEGTKRYLPIVQLGIQALPGTAFYLNGQSANPIYIGSTGVYELDLSGNVEITQLNFVGASLKRIDESPNGYLIVDIIYDEEDE